MARNKQNTDAAPVIEQQQEQQQPVIVYGKEPADLTAGVRVMNIGDDTGRRDKSGNVIRSKSLAIRIPKSSETGLTGKDAIAKADSIGKAIKPAIMARVAAFSNDAAVMVSTYRETPGKRDKVSLTLVKCSVVDEYEKLARTYGMTVEEVRSRLSAPKLTEIAV